MVTSPNNQGMPNFNTPFLDSNGQMTFAWYQFFVSLWNRTGGGSPQGNVTFVSVTPGTGVVASVANPGTTPNINISLDGSAATGTLSLFTSSTRGVVPASGGSTTNFLRADGSWISPFGFNTSTPVTNTGYVTALDRGGNSIRLMTS